MSTLKPMTVWKALNERKVLKDRIQRKSNSLEYFAVSTKGSEVVNGIDRDTYEAKLAANFNSIYQLYKNLEAYDAAIAEFNAKTEITIGGKTYTIAAAIARKQRLESEKDFIDNVISSLTATIRQISKDNDTILNETKINENVGRLLAERKFKVEEIAKGEEYLRDKYISDNTRVLVDPLNLYSKLDTLMDEINTFDNELNEKFNLVNVTNEITVELEDISV